jgi:hypothetical protein
MHLSPSQKVLYFSYFLFLFNKLRNEYNFDIKYVIEHNIYIYIYIYKNEPNTQIHSCNILLQFCYGDEIQLQSKQGNVTGNNKA